MCIRDSHWAPTGIPPGPLLGFYLFSTTYITNYIIYLVDGMNCCSIPAVAFIVVYTIWAISQVFRKKPKKTVRFTLPHCKKPKKPMDPSLWAALCYILGEGYEKAEEAKEVKANVFFGRLCAVYAWKVAQKLAGGGAEEDKETPSKRKKQSRLSSLWTPTPKKAAAGEPLVGEPIEVGDANMEPAVAVEEAAVEEAAAVPEPMELVLKAIEVGARHCLACISSRNGAAKGD